MDPIVLGVALIFGLGSRRLGLPPLVGFLETALADVRWSESIPEGAARSAAPVKEGA